MLIGENRSGPLGSADIVRISVSELTPVQATRFEGHRPPSVTGFGKASATTRLRERLARGQLFVSEGRI
jgi:hypothetical protein